MILDIIMVAIVALLTFIGIKRGIARTLYNLVSVAAAGFLAYILSKAAADWIFRTMIASSVEKSIESSAGSVAESVEGVADTVPDAITGLLNFFGISQKSLQSSIDSAAQSSSKTVSAAVNSALGPVITAVLSVVLLVMIFVLLILLFKLLSRFVLKLFELPVIKGANAVLGGVLGFLEGFILCVIGVMVLRIVLPFSSEPFISRELIDSSLLFRQLYDFELISGIADAVALGANTAETAPTAPTETVAALR